MKCDELKQIFIPTRGVTGDTLLGVGYYPSNAVDEAIAELKAEIKKLKENQQWKKFPNEKPEVGMSVLISDGFLRRVGSLMYDNTWNVDEAFYSTDEFTYWQNLPETPAYNRISYGKKRKNNSKGNRRL